MSAEDKWKAALGTIDFGEPVQSTDTLLENPPRVVLAYMKIELKDLMRWTAAVWLDNALKPTVCEQCRSFYVWLSRIAEQLFYATRDFDDNKLNSLYRPKEGE